MNTPNNMTSQTSVVKTRSVWTAPTMQVAHMMQAEHSQNPGLIDLGIGPGGIGIGLFYS